MNRKPRILHITPAFLPAFGGQENCILSLALRHCKDWDVRIFANYRSHGMHGDKYRVYHQLPKTWLLIDDYSRLGRRYMFSQLYALQCLHRFDVWDAHFTNQFGQIVVEFALRHGIPCVWSVHGPACAANAAAFSNKFPRLLKNNSHSLIMVAGAAYLADQVNTQSKVRCVHVPRGCDHDLFRRTPASPDGGRHAFNLIAVARNVPEKRLFLALTTIKTMLDSGHRDVGLTIVTSHLAHLEEAVRQLGLTEHVRLLLTRDLQHNDSFCLPPVGVVAEIKAADCVLSLSETEASPNVPIEAFVAGRTVIASDLPAHRELIQDSVNGFIVQEQTPEAVAERVLCLKSDSKLWSSMCAEAKKSGQKHDWDHSAGLYADVYRQAIAGKRK